jgi:hypothetical protein
MNLYHWTQPGLPTDFVRKIISDSWDNMTVDEKQVYEKQVNKQKKLAYVLFFGCIAHEHKI